MEQKAEEAIKRVTQLSRHITEVQRNCLILGERLIAGGEIELGRHLIANSMSHDQSKFHGIEWDFLTVTEDVKKDDLELAVTQHNRTNSHHPEFWGNIQRMPEVALAELVADWKARSSEFGSSLQEWVDKGAAKRFGYTKRDRVYRSIMRYVKLLVEPPFTSNT